MAKQIPSIDEWLKEAKQLEMAGEIGMYLIHNGVVRGSAKAKVRNNDTHTEPVKGMYFSYDAEAVEKVMEETKKLQGVFFIKVWLNEGELSVGDDIMYVLVGGDIRPHVIDGLQYLVGRIKNECVIEKEIY